MREEIFVFAAFQRGGVALWGRGEGGGGRPGGGQAAGGGTVVNKNSVGGGSTFWASVGDIPPAPVSAPFPTYASYI